ncbi:hypothetical protein [Kitasatospora mediocidica]|uniref:hypothetical protein n=1 Tax=Kitasatospora mediocidica TaxID=58352 RepID=UPI00068E56CF|nr:hypothetical protein [Kitasatospora mediocidica]
MDGAGKTAEAAVGRARDKAPAKPGFWSQVGDGIGGFFSGAGHVAKEFGETALGDVASVGNAMLHDPGSVAEMAGGLALASVGAGGEVLGVALDATGVGAVIGVPANVVSAGAIATGAGLMSMGAMNIGKDAAGSDRVNMNSDSGGGGGGNTTARDIHGTGRVSERGVDVGHVWDNGDMYIQGDGQIVKVLDNGNGTCDVVICDISNPTGKPTTVLKDAKAELC